ncbi:hypothetical protein Tcan_08238 [Toxocara canis]|uniref:Uncharacterized protein n=1 Tax=Toxocara canis TaxID=6265 RepID=A0A0B2VDF2_TOXCA|nr:hypothetical protein Tcan_08238 [Toxocara canis]
MQRSTVLVAVLSQAIREMTVQRYQIVSHRPMCFWSAMDTEEWLKRKRPKLALKYAHLFLKHYITGRICDFVSAFLFCYEFKKEGNSLLKHRE